MIYLVIAVLVLATARVFRRRLVGFFSPSKAAAYTKRLDTKLAERVKDLIADGTLPRSRAVVQDYIGARLPRAYYCFSAPATRNTMVRVLDIADQACFGYIPQPVLIG